MARSFSGSAGSLLRIASNMGITNAPLTLACWFKRTSASTAGYLVALSDAGGGTHIQSIFHSAAGDFGTESFNGVTYGAQAIASNDTNWHHGTGAHLNTSSRVAHVDGSQAGPQTSNVAALSLTELNVGALAGNTRTTGTIAAVGGWDVLLSDAEINSLRQGFPPRRVRPQSLKFYIPLIRDLHELRTGAAFATSGGSVADHPRAYGF